MTSPLYHPTYVLRQYAWAVLKLNDPTTWTEANYGNLIPIVPLAEEADLTEFDGPKIVYEYTIPNTGPSYYRNRGTMSFAVMDDNFRRLTKTMTTLQAAFERHDETARDVNAFIAASPLEGIGFGSINLGFVDGGTPEENEGGRQVGVISVSFDYFVDYEVDTTPTPLADSIPRLVL